MRQGEEPETTVLRPSPLEGAGLLLKRSAEQLGAGAGQRWHLNPRSDPSPSFFAEAKKLSLSRMGRGMTSLCLVVMMLVFATSAQAQHSASSIFDGQTLNGWTTLDGQPVTEGWEVVDGEIHLPPSSSRAGHIITDRDIGNFSLSFDFKIAPGGNSGIKYRVRDFNGNMLGCEYQVYDDDHPTKPVEPKNSTGSLYDVYEPIANKPLNPAGEWNSGKIVVNGDRIEHWLNNELILSVLVGSLEWYQRIADSKFHDDPGFGQNRFGRLMLTDHGSELWYRNFEVEELPTEPAPLLASSTAHCPTSVSPCRGRCPPVMTSNRVVARLNCRPWCVRRVHWACR